MPADTTTAALFRRLVVAIAPRLHRLESTALGRLGTSLTHRQYRILYQVGLGRETMTTIATVAGTSFATVSESVEALHRRGLLERQNDENDRRVSRLRLTDDGRKALAAAEAKIDELVDQLAADFEIEAIDHEAFAVAAEALERVVREHHARMNRPG